MAQEPTRSVERRRLDDGWRVREVPLEFSSPSCTLPWLPAQVPGHVHLDLMRAGVIQDPFYRMAERGAVWVDSTDWLYETTFTVDEPTANDTFLHFQGLDTVAEITLNGNWIGKTDNMFIPHEFNVGSLLKEGENTLQVLFHSALRVGWERQKAWNAAGNDTLENDWFMWNARSFVRKAQYMYGWDWGPEPVSCGIWKSVELVSVPVARLLDWRYETEFSSQGSAVVRIEAFVERSSSAKDESLTLHARIPEVGNRWEESAAAHVTPVSASVPNGEGRIGVKLALVIENPKLWTPVGHGKAEEEALPTLYSLELSLEGESVLDSRKAKIGLRTVELIRERDEAGESFKFRVNGEDLFIKGANWIPANSFPSLLPHGTEVHEIPWQAGAREQQDRVRVLVQASADAGMNMLRIWGGGLYESEHFYDVCDELGILVWQDFPYACAYYPDRGDYAESARNEAIAAVRRLRVHPSLAIWCGNNENDQMYHDGWGGKKPPRYLGEAIYHDILPQVVEAEDPQRPYWPSSPFGGDKPNAQPVGDCHDWNVWHGVGDWVHYPENDARFLSEFGFASSCGLATWDACLAEMDREPYSPVVRWHDKTRKGYDTYMSYIRLHFPAPQTLTDLVYYSQVNQAEALKCGIEHWRRRKGHCWGTLFWQLNDCWPVQSWAVIDSEGEPKAAYYAAKRFYAPVLLSLKREGDTVEAHLTNDLLRPISGVVTFRIETFEGTTLVEETARAAVGANGTARVESFSLKEAAGKEAEVFVYAEFVPDADTDAPDADNLMLLAEPKDLRLPDPEITVDVKPNDRESFEVTVTAKKFAPHVWMRLKGQREWVGKLEWSDNFFSLRPGESRDLVLYTSSLLETPEETRTRLEIRSL